MIGLIMQIIKGLETPGTKEADMGRLSVLLLLMLLMFGCATSRETYTATGQRGHSIDCSGSALNWGMCYEKAGKLCAEKGYDVLAKSGDQGTVLAGNQFGLYGGSVTSRSMVIQCKTQPMKP